MAERVCNHEATTESNTTIEKWRYDQMRLLGARLFINPSVTSWWNDT